MANDVLLAPHCVNHARNATVTTKKKEPITKNAMADLKRSVFLFLSFFPSEYADPVMERAVARRQMTMSHLSPEEIISNTLKIIFQRHT